MKRTITTTLLSFSAWSAAAATEYLEPTVIRVEQVLPIDFCNTLIKLGEKGMCSDLYVCIICCLFFISYIVSFDIDGFYLLPALNKMVSLASTCI